MAVERAGQTAAGWAWLPDDTEESVVGTQWHQKAISTLADMLEGLRDEEGAPWDVGRQLGLRGFRRRDGTIYTPMPDVQVHPQRLPVDVVEISLADYGPPVLVVEVGSPSTVAADSGEKAATYARGGVQEYLVFDVSGTLLEGGPVWARRLSPEDGGTLRTWQPEADGRWHSAYGFALAPEGPLLRVYSRQGEPQATLSEQRRRSQEAERRRLEAEQRVATLETELRRLGGTAE